MTAVLACAAQPCDALAMAIIPLHPKHPERVCWGCDKYCPATDLACGNGTIRTLHPVELFGEDWLEWAEQRTQPAAASSCPATLQDPASLRR